MAQYRLNAYDADVYIQQFLGMQKTRTEVDGDLRFAEEAENVETPNGVLQPQAANTFYTGDDDQFASKKIETLMAFHRRWYTGSGSKDWMVAAVDGKLYYWQEGTSNHWVLIDMPTGVASYQSNVWSWVTYEIPSMDEEQNPITIDVVLISNAEDGMFMVVPPERPKNWNDIKASTWNGINGHDWDYWRSRDWQVQAVTTSGYKFGVIARHAERIFGSAIPDEPDLVVWSAPYAPADWEPDTSDPANGSGENRLPTWDGDTFTAMIPFGDQLLIFKRNHLWRVMGTDPGIYTFKEQYGGGSPFFNTVVSGIERVYMADRDGLSIYDGMSVAPYLRTNTERVWRRVNRNAMDQMCAAIHNRRYYLAIPIDGSTYNNALLVYNLEEGTILFYTKVYIESLLASEDGLFYTTSKVPGVVMKMNYDSWQCGSASGEPAKWVSPWMDFGRKDIQKGGFDLYFNPEVQDEAVTITFSVQTEKKTKRKSYTIQPLTADQAEAGKLIRNKRLHFGGSGRKFRVIIETADGITAPWRLIGGVQMIVETDPD